MKIEMQYNGILDLYNKEKEKNKGLNATLTLVNIGLENYISKDKIREKIEIYRIAISDSKDGDFIHDVRQKIQVLKELLEE